MADTRAAAARVRVLVPYMLAFQGGVRRVLGDGLRHLSAAGRVDVAYAELCANPDDMAEMQAGGVRIEPRIGLPASGVLSRRRGVARMASLVRASPRMLRLMLRLRRAFTRYDVVYVHGLRDLALVVGAATINRSRTRPAIVWHCHDTLIVGAQQRLLRTLLRRCDRIIAVSHYVAGWLRGLGAAEARITVVPNAVDLVQGASLVSPLPQVDPGAVIMLLAAASHRRDKGGLVAIRALAELPDRFVLWLTGSLEDPVAAPFIGELRELADRLRVAERVHFLGARTDIYAVMRAAHVIVVPSTCEEGFGLVAAEGMGLGVPVVASDRGGLTEVIHAGAAGLLFDAGDASSLANRVRELETADARARLGAHGVSRVRDHFNYVRWAEQVADALASACKRPTLGQLELPRDGVAEWLSAGEALPGNETSGARSI